MLNSKDWLTWLGAFALGFAALFWLMPLATIAGFGPYWDVVMGDNAQSLSMHLAFQNDAWQWPPLWTTQLFWPHGAAASMGDLNPLFSLVAKAIVRITGSHPINLMGVWYAFCWVLLPPACVYAMYGLGEHRVIPCLVAAALGVMSPALLARLMHMNLLGHFLFILAFGLGLRLMQRSRDRDWVMAFLVLLTAVLTHPYIYMLCAAMLAAPAMHGLIRTRRPDWRLWRRTGLAIVLPVVVLTIASGALGGGDKGFAKYSMNVLSLVMPVHSGLFGPELAMQDGTGGQYEGFAYLGAGVLLLVALWLTTRPWRRSAPYRGMLVVMIGLFVLALGSQVYVGKTLVLNLGLKPWEDIFGVFRANGRAIWPVAAALMLVGVASAARRPAIIAWPVLAIALVLQVLDTAPFLRDARNIFEGHSEILTLPALPGGANVLSVAPAPGCATDPHGIVVSSPLLLKGVRAGMALGDVGLGRQPKWFNCEKFLSEGLESPLHPHELRSFTDPATWTGLGLGVFGNATCAKQGDVLFCSDQTGALAGQPYPLPGPDSVARLQLGSTDPQPFLGFGWKTDGQGMIWSEGPRTSLRLRLAAPGDHAIRLDLTGIAFAAGDPRRLWISLNGEPVAMIDLPDLTATSVTVPLPASALVNGVAWLALDVVRPVDPARRGLTAPVSRASLKLGGVALLR